MSDDDDDIFRKKPSLIASMQQKLQSELERSVIDPGYQIETGPGRPALWAKHSYPLHSSHMVRDAVNPQAWTIEDVLEFLSSVPCLEEYGKTFKDQVCRTKFVIIVRFILNLQYYDGFVFLFISFFPLFLVLGYRW